MTPDITYEALQYPVILFRFSLQASLFFSHKLHLKNLEVGRYVAKQPGKTVFALRTLAEFGDTKTKQCFLVTWIKIWKFFANIASLQKNNFPQQPKTKNLSILMEPAKHDNTFKVKKPHPDKYSRIKDSENLNSKQYLIEYISIVSSLQRVRLSKGQTMS